MLSKMQLWVSKVPCKRGVFSINSSWWWNGTWQMVNRIVMLVREKLLWNENLPESGRSLGVLLVSSGNLKKLSKVREKSVIYKLMAREILRKYTNSTRGQRIIHTLKYYLTFLKGIFFSHGQQILSFKCKSQFSSVTFSSEKGKCICIINLRPNFQVHYRVWKILTRFRKTSEKSGKIKCGDEWQPECRPA